MSWFFNSLHYHSIFYMVSYNALQGWDGNTSDASSTCFTAERANLVYAFEGGAGWGVDECCSTVKAFLVGCCVSRRGVLISMPHRKSWGTEWVRLPKRNLMSVSLHTWYLCNATGDEALNLIFPEHKVGGAMALTPEG